MFSRYLYWLMSNCTMVTLVNYYHNGYVFVHTYLPRHISAVYVSVANKKLINKFNINPRITTYNAWWFLFAQYCTYLSSNSLCLLFVITIKATQILFIVSLSASYRHCVTLRSIENVRKIMWCLFMNQCRYYIALAMWCMGFEWMIINPLETSNYCDTFHTLIYSSYTNHYQ